MGRTLTLTRGTFSPNRTLDTVAKVSSRVIAQHRGTAGSAVAYAEGVNQYAQIFRARQPYVLSAVAPILNRVGLPGNASVGIRRTAVVAGNIKPTGNNLASASFNADTVPVGTFSGGISVSLKLSPSIKLEIGSQYAIVLAAPNGQIGARRLGWPIGSPSNTADGLLWQSTDGGATWPASDAFTCRYSAFGNILSSRDLDP